MTSFTVRTAHDLQPVSGGHSSLAAAEHHLDLDAFAASLHPHTRAGQPIELVITRDSSADTGPTVAIHCWLPN